MKFKRISDCLMLLLIYQAGQYTHSRFSLSFSHINISMLCMCTARIMEAWWLTSNKSTDGDRALINSEIWLHLKEERHAHRCFSVLISTCGSCFQSKIFISPGNAHSCLVMSWFVPSNYFSRAAVVFM